MMENQGDRKYWILFLLVSAIYISISIGVCYNRTFNLDYLAKLPLEIYDYSIHSILASLVSKGISPFSGGLFQFGKDAIIPDMWRQYAGGTLFNSALVVLTGQSATFTVFCVSPVVINIVMVACVYVSCRILNLSPKRSLLFLIFFLFLNDQMIYLNVYANGEHLSTAMGLVGLSYFIAKKYYHSIPFIFVSFFVHPIGYSHSAILLISFTLLLVYLLVWNRSKLYSMLSNLNNIHNSDTKRVYSLAILVVVTVGYIYPLFTPRVYEVNVPDTSKTTSVTSEIVTIVTTSYSTQTKVIDITESNTTISTSVVSTQTEKSTTTTSEGSSVTSTVSTSQSISYIPDTIIDRISEGSDISVYSTWVNPRSTKDVLLMFLYPITYIYQNAMGRASLNSTLQVFGYTLTKDDVENLRNFSLNTPIQVALVPVVYSLGFPLIFLAMVYVCIKTRNAETISLSLGAYLLIIGFGLLFYFFGISLYPARFIKTVGCVFLLSMFTSGYTKERQKSENLLILGFSAFLIIRLAIYALGVIHINA